MEREASLRVINVKPFLYVQRKQTVISADTKFNYKMNLK